MRARSLPTSGTRARNRRRMVETQSSRRRAKPARVDRQGHRREIGCSLLLGCLDWRMACWAWGERCAMEIGLGRLGSRRLVVMADQTLLRRECSACGRLLVPWWLALPDRERRGVHPWCSNTSIACQAGWWTTGSGSCPTRNPSSPTRSKEAALCIHPKSPSSEQTCSWGRCGERMLV